jgi:hypothetical protein
VGKLGLGKRCAADERAAEGQVDFIMRSRCPDYDGPRHSIRRRLALDWKSRTDCYINKKLIVVLVARRRHLNSVGLVVYGVHVRRKSKQESSFSQLAAFLLVRKLFDSKLFSQKICDNLLVKGAEPNKLSNVYIRPGRATMCGQRRGGEDMRL